MENFLKSNEDPNYPSWSEIDPAWVFPNPTHLKADPEGFAPNNASYQRIVDNVREQTVENVFDIEPMRDAVLGMEQVRKETSTTGSTRTIACPASRFSFGRSRVALSPRGD